MDKHLAVELKKQAKISDCLEENKELVEKYPRLKQEKEIFDVKRLRIAAQAAKKGEVTTGITVDKVWAFSNYGNLLHKGCLKGTVWAKDTNNQTLVAVFAITPTKFDRQTYAKKLEQGDAIYTALSKNAIELAAAVDLTATELAAIAEAKRVCEIADIAPSKAITDKKTANDGTYLALADIDESIETMGNLIFSQYSVTEPDFVVSYKNNCIADSVGVRHTGLIATITDAATGKAIENATLTIIGLNKTATSNMAGLAEISRMKSGSYHISISAEGYTTQLQDVTVGKGKVVDLVVALVLA